MTSPSTEDKYQCQECRDTGWTQSEHGYARCKCYEIDYIERLWANYGIKPKDVKKLNEYEPYDTLTSSAKDKAINYIKKFDDIKGERENSFGLFGQPGSGKTHIIVSIGAALINSKEKVPVIYMPYLEAMRELKANSMDDEYYNKISSRYQRAKVLIIDDLFKDKVKKGKLMGELSDTDMKHIYPILNYRYLNYLPTLVSTECTPNMLLNLDEALAGRILETCGDNMTVFAGQKYNWRMRKFIKD